MIQRFWVLLLFLSVQHCSSVPISAFYPYGEGTVDKKISQCCCTIDNYVSSINLSCGQTEKYNVRMHLDFIPHSWRYASLSQSYIYIIKNMPLCHNVSLVCREFFAYKFICNHQFCQFFIMQLCHIVYCILKLNTDWRCLASKLKPEISSRHSFMVFSIINIVYMTA